MSVIEIRGGNPLQGELWIQGSKNAALPMMAAAVLHKGTTVLTGVPRIRDVFCMVEILESLGCGCQWSGHELVICAGELSGSRIPRRQGMAMRSSVVLLGALLGRLGEGAIPYPGGCSIGSRPVDFHLKAFRQMGAVIREQEGMLVGEAKSLHGSCIRLPYPSVGATENILLAAVLADGETVICGAAKEPEIVELCRMLSAMGARIHGAGSSRVCIRGVKELSDCSFFVGGDRIAAGTYGFSVMAAGGAARFLGIRPSYIEGALQVMEQMGAKVRREEEAFSVAMKGRPCPASVSTMPYPGFPTDLQSPLLAVLSMADGRGEIRETVFEGRFGTASELEKLGARIRVKGNLAETDGRWPLYGAAVMAPDLRGGAALAVAGLGAEGTTRILGCSHIFRGYEDICGDLGVLGAEIHQKEEASGNG